MTISADTFTFVADLVRRRSAIELIVGKEYLVECRLLPLVRLAGLDGVDEYVDTLRKVGHSAELDRVVEALTTNETYWFRDVTPFQILTGHVTGMKRREQVFRNRNALRERRRSGAVHAKTCPRAPAR